MYLQYFFNLMKDYFILQYYSFHLAICKGFHLPEAGVKTKRVSCLILKMKGPLINKSGSGFLSL